MMTPTLAELSAAARQVAAQTEERDAAIAEERAAEAAILALALAAVRPALRSLCSRLVQIDESVTHADPRGSRSRTEYHTERGLHLAGAKEAERVTTTSANSGRYGGAGLVLLADGQLAERTFEGSWDRHAGAKSGWESTLREISPTEAAATWELAECLEALGAALEAQLVGRGPERAKAARARAAKLTAILRLVQS